MRNKKLTTIMMCAVFLLHNSFTFSQEILITITVLNTKDEYVLIKNEGESPINLQGWILHDHDYGKASIYSHIFEELVLKPGEILQMQSGKKDDDDPQRDEQAHKQPEVTYYLRWSERNVWNNRCDIAYLVDTDGNLVTEAHEGTELRNRNRDNCR